MPYALWMVDITEETVRCRSRHINTAEAHSSIEPGHQCGAHQPAEQVYDNKMFVTWFSGGLRVVDISNPISRPRSASYVPSSRPRTKEPSRATISSAPTMVCFIWSTVWTDWRFSKAKCDRGRNRSAYLRPPLRSIQRRHQEPETGKRVRGAIEGSRRPHEQAHGQVANSSASHSSSSSNGSSG